MTEKDFVLYFKIRQKRDTRYTKEVYDKYGDAFYSDPSKFIRLSQNTINTLSKIKNARLMIEIVNEPRFYLTERGDREKFILAIKRKKILSDWTDQIAKWIKSEVENCTVHTGDEGWVVHDRNDLWDFCDDEIKETMKGYTLKSEDWIKKIALENCNTLRNNGVITDAEFEQRLQREIANELERYYQKYGAMANNYIEGVDFAANASSRYVDYASLHAYFYHEGPYYHLYEDDDHLKAFRCFLKTRKAYLHQLRKVSKPIILFELGSSVFSSEKLTKMVQIAKKEGISGVFIWAYEPWQERGGYNVLPKEADEIFASQNEGSSTTPFAPHTKKS